MDSHHLHSYKSDLAYKEQPSHRWHEPRYTMSYTQLS